MVTQEEAAAVQSSPPLVSVTIVTWNSGATLAACLDAVLNQTLVEIEIIVVDHDSTDETLIILQNYPGVKLYRQTANLGFSKGHNIAMAQARGRYVLPLNPDVVLGETYLEHMVWAAEANPEVGVVAGKLLLDPSPSTSEPSPLIDSTGLFLAKTRRQLLRGHRETDDQHSYNQPEYVFGADGAAPLYRKAMLDACQFKGQYFDESFFAYKEDVDLAWRAQLLGWKSFYTPQAVAVHLRTFKPGRRRGLSKTVRMHSVKNRYLLLIKNELPLTFLRHMGHILFYDIKILAYIFLFEPSSIKGLIKAVALLPCALRWRRFIMAHRKVDAAYMLTWMK